MAAARPDGDVANELARNVDEANLEVELANDVVGCYFEQATE